MILDDLYSELEVGFQPEERGEFIEELAYIAKSQGGLLGSYAPEAEKSPLELLAEELGSESVSLPNRLEINPLDLKLFKKLNIAIPPYLQEKMEHNNFFLVDLPLTLLPRPGWGFVRLECRVAFNPDYPPAEQPIIYQVFPEESWQEIAHAWQGLEIGLDENLEFKFDPVKILPEIEKLDLPLKTAVMAKAAGKAGLVLGPFDYYISRPKILSQGRGNIKAIWRLNGEDEILQKKPRLGLVLQVPNNLKQVDGYGVLAVYRKFHFFSAELRDIKEIFNPRSLRFFDNSAPASDKKTWPGLVS